MRLTTMTTLTDLVRVPTRVRFETGRSALDQLKMDAKRRIWGPLEGMGYDLRGIVDRLERLTDATVEAEAEQELQKILASGPQTVNREALAVAAAWILGIRAIADAEKDLTKLLIADQIWRMTKVLPIDAAKPVWRNVRIVLKLLEKGLRLAPPETKPRLTPEMAAEATAHYAAIDVSHADRTGAQDEQTGATAELSAVELELIETLVTYQKMRIACETAKGAEFPEFPGHHVAQWLAVGGSKDDVEAEVEEHADLFDLDS